MMHLPKGCHPRPFGVSPQFCPKEALIHTISFRLLGGLEPNRFGGSGGFPFCPPQEGIQNLLSHQSKQAGRFKLLGSMKLHSMSSKNGSHRVCRMNESAQGQTTHPTPPCPQQSMELSELLAPSQSINHVNVPRTCAAYDQLRGCMIAGYQPFTNHAGWSCGPPSNSLSAGYWQSLGSYHPSWLSTTWALGSSQLPRKLTLNAHKWGGPEANSGPEEQAGHGN